MRRLIAHGTVVAVLLAAPVFAQVGGGYDLSRNTFDGGGASAVGAGSYRFSGTIGQPDAGRLQAGGVVVAGGFWASVRRIVTPTVTPTSTPTATFTATFTPSQTPTSTATITPSVTPSVTLTATGVPPVLTATPTHTPVGICVGDCNNDGAVTIDELITLVNIALGTAQPSACPHGIPSGAEVDVALIIQAVNAALIGCTDPAQACLASGGQVTEVDCYCSGTPDFFNNCAIGACSCPPTGAPRHLNSCDCGSGKCWNGNACVVRTLP